mmetsp:Transcript_9062/g.26319  ORF Transcript_9062/g.26319 Transcript_9062/m.26319 type:complete len:272 (+) Transcript_9062:103-918(+)
MPLALANRKFLALKCCPTRSYPTNVLMANKIVFSLNSILFFPAAPVSPKCAGVPSKTTKSRFEPKPSNEAPPQSLPTINSYASLIALNSATSASGLRSGCAVEINFRYFALISLGSSFAVAPNLAYARSNAPSSPLLAANPSTQFSNDPQSSIPYSKSTCSISLNGAPAMLNAIAQISVFLAGSIAVTAGTPSIFLGSFGLSSVSGISIPSFLNAMLASNETRSATKTSATGSQSVRSGTLSSLEPLASSDFCLTDNTYSLAVSLVNWKSL